MIHRPTYRVLFFFFFKQNSVLCLTVRVLQDHLRLNTTHTQNHEHNVAFAETKSHGVIRASTQISNESLGESACSEYL